MKNKIVHLFPCEKFTSDYINTINKYFDTEKHYFVIYGNKKDYRLDIHFIKNVIFVHKLAMLDSKVSCILKKANKIITHSLNDEVINMFYFRVDLINKLYICLWGFEIYSMLEKKGILRKLKSIPMHIKKVKVLKNAKGIITLLDGDYKVLNNIIHTKGKSFTTCYCTDDLSQKEEDQIDLKKTVDPYCILIGNSATSTNNHKEIFYNLAKYKNENLIIYVPLSYGDPAYRDIIVKLGKELFGDKFVPLTKFINIKDYRKLLAKCSVALFNNNRQQAMGNINLLTKFEAKIYLRDDTVMWEEFVRIRKYKYFNIKEVGSISFNNFIMYDDKDRIINRDIIQFYTSTKRMVDLWTKVFNFNDEINLSS